jgi:HSP20 family protein
LRTCHQHPGKDNEYEIQLVVPGMKRDDFQMEVEENVLSVSYEKKEDEASNDESKFLRKEFSLEGFNRRFALPKHTDAENIKARYENGMLYIAIPREDPKKDKLSKRIEIADQQHCGLKLHKLLFKSMEATSDEIPGWLLIISQSCNGFLQKIFLIFGLK